MRSICGWHYDRIDDGNEEDLTSPPPGRSQKSSPCWVRGFGELLNLKTVQKK
jgi:hypothetical protein